MSRLFRLGITSPKSLHVVVRNVIPSCLFYLMMLKRVFRLTLRALQGFINSIFTLMKFLLRCPDYSCVSRRAKSVSIPFKSPTRGEIAHLVIDSTGLKVFDEGEWKVKKLD